jgi:transketolase
MRNIFINELTNLAEKDPNIFLIVGDLGYGVIDEFQNKFPERFLNVGVAEQNMIGVAAGLAKSGYKYLLREASAYLAYITVGKRGIQISDHLPDADIVTKVLP